MFIQQMIRVLYKFEIRLVWDLSTSLCAHETSGKFVKLIGSEKKEISSSSISLIRQATEIIAEFTYCGGFERRIILLRVASNHAAPEVVSERRQSQRNTTQWSMWEEYKRGWGGVLFHRRFCLASWERAQLEWKVWIDRMILR